MLLYDLATISTCKEIFGSRILRNVMRLIGASHKSFDPPLTRCVLLKPTTNNISEVYTIAYCTYVAV